MDLIKCINKDYNITLDNLNNYEQEFFGSLFFNAKNLPDIYENEEGEDIINLSSISLCLSLFFVHSYEDLKGLKLTREEVEMFCENAMKYRDDLTLIANIMDKTYKDNILHEFPEHILYPRRMYLNALSFLSITKNKKYSLITFIELIIFYNFHGPLFDYKMDKLCSIRVRDVAYINRLEIFNPQLLNLVVNYVFANIIKRDDDILKKSSKLFIDLVNEFTGNFQQRFISLIKSYVSLNERNCLKMMKFTNLSILFFGLYMYKEKVHLHPFTINGETYNTVFSKGNELNACFSIIETMVYSRINSKFLRSNKRKLEEIDEEEEFEAVLRDKTRSPKDRMLAINMKTKLLIKRMKIEEEKRIEIKNSCLNICTQEERSYEECLKDESLYIFNINGNRYFVDKESFLINCSKHENIFYISDELGYDREKISRDPYVFLNLLGASPYPVLIRISNFVAFGENRELFVRESGYKCKSVTSSLLVRYDDISTIGRKHGTEDTGIVISTIGDGTFVPNYYQPYTLPEECIGKRFFPDPRFVNEEISICTLTHISSFSNDQKEKRDNFEAIRNIVNFIRRII